MRAAKVLTAVLAVAAGLVLTPGGVANAETSATLPPGVELVPFESATVASESIQLDYAPGQPNSASVTERTSSVATFAADGAGAVSTSQGGAAVEAGASSSFACVQNGTNDEFVAFEPRRTAYEGFGREGVAVFHFYAQFFAREVASQDTVQYETCHLSSVQQFDGRLFFVGAEAHMVDENDRILSWDIPSGKTEDLGDTTEVSISAQVPRTPVSISATLSQDDGGQLERNVNGKGGGQVWMTRRDCGVGPFINPFCDPGSTHAQGNNFQILWEVPMNEVCRQVGDAKICSKTFSLESFVIGFKS